MRLLDLLRRATPTASTRPRAASRGCGAELGRAGVGLGLAGEPADPLQPRLGRPRRQAVVGAQDATSGGTRSRASGPGDDVPDFAADKPPDYVPPDGRDGRGRAARRRAVHHEGRRPRLALRARRPGRRPAADPLRAARVAVRATRSTAQQANPARQQFRRPENPYNPTAGEPGADVFPYVITTYRLTEHHTAGGDDPLAALPGRAAAGDVLRGLARARRRARPRARRLGDDRRPRARAIEARVLVTERLAPLRGRRAATRPPGRPALALGPARPHAPATPPTTCSRSRSTRTCTSRRQGVDLRHPPGRRPRGPALRDARRATTGSAPGSTRRSAAMSGRPTVRRARRAADGLLHRHDASASAARRARSPARSGTSCPRTALGFTGESYDNTGGAGRRTPGGTSRSSSRSRADRRATAHGGRPAAG